MNQEDIKKILPHRDAMLLVEEVTKTESVVDGQPCSRAHGSYHVRGDEWFLQGHFPGNPVVPGVILCEMLAQTACVLLDNDAASSATPMFSGLKDVRFKAPVRPGDTFLSECTITRIKHPFYFASAVGRVGEKVCVTADFSFALVES